MSDPRAAYGEIGIPGEMVGLGVGSTATAVGQLVTAFDAKIDEMCFSLTRDFALMLYGKKPTVHEAMRIFGPRKPVRRRLTKRERRWERERTHRAVRRKWSRGPWDKGTLRLIEWAASS